MRHVPHSTGLMHICLPARVILAPARRPGAFWLAICVAALGLFADQATKLLASAADPDEAFIRSGSNAIAVGRMVANPGALGGVGGELPGASLAGGLLGVLLVAVLARWAWRDSVRWRPIEAIGWGLVLGGVTGNVADRLILGHVRDFLTSSLLSLWIFNVADLLAVCGALILVAASLPALFRPREPLKAAA